MLDKMKKYLSNESFLMVLGTLFLIMTCIPFFILGEDSVVTYHDQLDGEIMTYILNARYLGSFSSFFPELMNGIPRTGMIPPAVLFVPLFRIFSPFTSFMIMKITGMLVGFVFMYKFLRMAGIRSIASFISALIFALLPFYPVYGFCIIGQPLLWYAFIQLKKSIGKPIYAYVCIVLFALGSSLALVGFACIMVTFVWSILELVFRTKSKWRILTGMLVLTATYAVTNLSLILQALGLGAQTVSHKSELVLQPFPFGKHVFDIFLSGVNYAGSNQIIIIPMLLLAVFILIGELRKPHVGQSATDENKDFKNCLRRLVCLLILQVGISVLCGVYQTDFIVSLRNNIGGIIKEFNAERIAWIMPIIWFTLLAVTLDVIWDSKKSITSFLRKSVVVVFFVGMITLCLYKSDTKLTVMKLLKGNDYYAITWEQFFAKDLFDEIKSDIGLKTEDYRVVSFGIYPSAAAYNGFYCLDAYSNNYDVAYKHEFRKVIEPELNKSDYLKKNFDFWGNRCYITSAESMDYYTFEKRWTPVTQNLDLNTEQLKNMGCRYIISASYLMNPDILGVKLYREEPYMNDSSWYRLYVYEIL